MTNKTERDQLLDIIEEAGRTRTAKKITRRVTTEADGKVIEDVTEVEDVTLPDDPEAAAYAKTERARRRQR